MTFEIKDLKVEILFVIKKGKRGWSLRYKEKNIFQFTSPKMMSNDEIYLELSKHYRFMKRCLNSMPKVHKESLHLFGKEYELVEVNSDIRRMVLLGDKIYLYTNTDNKEINQKIANAFYQENLSYFVSKNIDKVASDMNINFKVNVDYKQVKTYYGECIPKQKRIIFQESLAKYEEKYILSVMYHEFAHFYYMNHQQGFYNLLERVFPGYKEVQASLRRTKYNDKY